MSHPLRNGFDALSESVTSSKNEDTIELIQGIYSRIGTAHSVLGTTKKAVEAAKIIE